MKKQPKEFIQDYWKEVKKKYPEINYEQYEQVCRSVFRFIKGEIRGYEFPEIRLKYFGKFMVQKGRAKAMYKKLDETLAKGNISRKEHDLLKHSLLKYLEDGEEK